MNRLRRFWSSLTPSEQGKLKKAIALVGAALTSILLRRFAATAVVAVTSSMVTASIVDVNAQAKAQRSCASITKSWLTKAGHYRVERMPMPKPGVTVDRCRPPVGVGHTIEGSLESGLSVFRRHYAPHFTVGRDRAGRVRIIQHVPLGEIAAALANRSGGVETNRWARAQVELAGFSKTTPWEPDAGVMKAYGALVLELRDVAGIPLVHPFPDALASGVRWATLSNPRRISGKWGRTAGWFNHLEVPENEHWDAGAMRWSRLFEIALAQAKPIGGGGHDRKPPPKPQVPKYRITASKPGSVRRLVSAAPGKSTGRLAKTGYRRISIVRVR
jgi:hypothetical protein